MTVESPFGNGREQVLFDENFRPDISKRRIGFRCLEIMERWGMESVGSPIPGPSPYSHAVWFGTLVNRNGEIPVLRAAAANRYLDLRTGWFCGYAVGVQDPEAITDETIMEYGDQAFQEATGPESAIVRALALLEGPEAIPPQLGRFAG